MSEREGDLPNGWVRATIDELCDLNPKHDRELSDETPVSFVPMAGVSEVFGTITEPQVRTLGEVRKGYTHFSDGDVIFAKITPCMENGKSASVRGMTSGLACGTTEFYVFRSRGALDQDFLFQFIRQESYRKAARATMQSGVGQARVPKEFVLNTELPVPPLAEQRRIVAKIEALQERSRRAREALSEVGPLLDQFRQSVLAAAFRGDLTADWRATHPNVEPASELLHRIRTERRRRWEQAELAKYEAKGTKPPKNWQDKYAEPKPVDDFDLPELPDRWCWAGLEELKDLSLNSMTDGPFGSKLKTSHYSDSGIRVVRLGNIGVGHFNGDDEAFIPQSHYEELRKHEIFAGDLVIAALAEPVGRCCKIPPTIGPAIVKADCIRFRPHPSVFTEIVMHWLNSGTGRKFTEMASHGIGRLRINMENLRALPVALPPVDEQIEIIVSIANQLAGVARVEEQVSSYDEDLGQLNQSILGKAFRGELMPQDPNDEPASVLLERIREQRAQQAEATKARKKTAKTQPRNGTIKKSSGLASQQRPKADAQASTGQPIASEQLWLKY